MTIVRFPTTELDRDALRAMGHNVPDKPAGRAVPGLPNGCDYQGRHPQAAEACTDVGADDDTPVNRRERAIFWRFALALTAAIWAVVMLAIFSPHN